MYHIGKKIILSYLIALMSGMVASASENRFVEEEQKIDTKEGLFVPFDLKEGEKIETEGGPLIIGKLIKQNQETEQYVYKGTYNKKPVIIKSIDRGEYQQSLQACSLGIGPEIHFFIKSPFISENMNNRYFSGNQNKNNIIKVENFLEDVPITADNVKDIFSTLSRQLLTLDKAGIPHTDISPGNVIGNTFIDFEKMGGGGGTDFFSCKNGGNPSSSPVIALCRVVIWKLYKKDLQGWGKELYENVIETIQVFVTKYTIREGIVKGLFRKILDTLISSKYIYLYSESLDADTYSFWQVVKFFRLNECIGNSKMEELMDKSKKEWDTWKLDNRKRRRGKFSLSKDLRGEANAFCSDISNLSLSHFRLSYEAKIKSFSEIKFGETIIDINNILLDGALGRIEAPMQLCQLLDLNPQDEPITYNGNVYPCYYTNGEETGDFSISKEGEIVTARKSKDVLDISEFSSLDGSNHINTRESPIIYTGSEISRDDTSNSGYNLKVSIGISCAVICLIVVGLKVFRKPKPKGRREAWKEAWKSKKTITSNRHPHQSNSRLT